MKNQVLFLLLILVSLLFQDCQTKVPLPVKCKRGGINFDSPAFVLGSKYSAPSQIYNNRRGLSVNIKEIYFSSGNKSFNWGEIINNQPHSFGSGNVINLNNTVLSLDLPQKTRIVEFEYLFQGGLINLGAKGNKNIYIGSMYNLANPLIINGVTINRLKVIEIKNTNNQKIAEKGIIRLTHASDMGSLIIGGQEIMIDNLCVN
jgi:hypothetical protein